METSNPAFSEAAVKRMKASAESHKSMTKSGAMVKTALLLVFVVAAGAINWQLAASQNPLAITLTWVGALAALGLSLAVIFARRPNPVLIILYAIAEGLLLGGVSYIFNEAYSGIVVQAVLLTVAIFAAMFGLYGASVIRPTRKFQAGVLAATFGILIFYLITLILSLFGVQLTSLIVAGPLAIGIAAVIVIVAALNLLLDFGFVDEAVQANMPAEFEWYGAFGLMVTLIWLYVSILRLLAIINNSR